MRLTACSFFVASRYVAAMAFLLFIVYSLPAQDPYAPGPVPDRIILTWQGNPTTSQAVSWRTDTTVSTPLGQIALADASPDLAQGARAVEARTEKIKTNQNTALVHTASFVDLQPNTLYAYRVGDGKNWSEWFHFRTAQSGVAPFSFLYFGDAQTDLKSLWSRTIRQAYSAMPDVDFLLHAGDLINIATRDEEWGEWFYAGGWINGMKPSMPTPGNHEYFRNSEGGRSLSIHWRPSFALPENGPKGLEETVYYLDYQGVRFISLNTQAMLIDSNNIGIQQAWLETALQSNPNRWAVVFHHHPIYSTAQGRDELTFRKHLQPIYEKYGVDLVLQGHDHAYGRGHNLNYGLTHKGNKGPVYVVSVSGPKMYPNNFSDWMDRAASNTQLYQIITVDGAKLQYQAFTTTGVLYDAFALQKKKNGQNAFIDLAPKEVPERVELPQAERQKLSEEEIKKYRQRYQDYLQKKKG